MTIAKERTPTPARQAAGSGLGSKLNQCRHVGCDEVGNELVAKAAVSELGELCIVQRAAGKEQKERLFAAHKSHGRPER